MITLDDAIEIMEAQCGEMGLVMGVWLYTEDIVQYLKDYKALLERGDEDDKVQRKED